MNEKFTPRGIQQMKQVEFIQLQILKIVKEFDEFCREHHIEYSMGGGTLLGAVRHDGFIPWDDDFDVYMTRKDAEKFIKLWRSESLDLISFKEKRYYKPYTSIKIHNPRYRLKELGDEKYKFPELTNYGIFIDIFIIDFYSKSLVDKVISKYFGQILMANFLSSYNRSIERFEVKVAYYIPSLIIRSLKYLIARRFRMQNRNYVGFGWDVPFSNFFMKRDEYFPLKQYKFCGLSLPGPQNAAIYLTQRFGNYMELPPLENRRNHILDIYKLENFED